MLNLRQIGITRVLSKLKLYNWNCDISARTNFDEIMKPWSHDEVAWVPKKSTGFGDVIETGSGGI